MIKAIHAQESWKASDNKTRAIVDDCSQQNKQSTYLVEQAVDETLTHMVSRTFDPNQQSAEADHEGGPAHDPAVFGALWICG